MTPTTQPLRAVTSASNIFRRKLCPGSERMEAGLASMDNEYSAEGTMLHRLFLTGDRPTYLTPDQVAVLDYADRLAHAFFDKFRAHVGIPEEAPFEDSHESDLMLTAADGSPLYPGHADVIRYWPAYSARAIVDAKFGYLDVEHAADNTQTASYAVMAYQARPVEHTGVAIIQPRNFGPHSTVAIYNEAAMPAALKELEEIAREARKEDAPRIAGEKQCHYCKAKVRCSAYIAQTNAMQLIGSTAITQLTVDNLIAVHRAIQFANKIKDEVTEEMRRRIQAGELPGWKLQNTGETTTLEDTTGFYETLARHFDGNPGFTASAFDACREMGWGKLTSLIQQLTGLSEKKAKEFIAELAQGYTTKTPKTPRVVEDKPKKLK